MVRTRRAALWKASPAWWCCMKENWFPELVIVRLFPNWFASLFSAGVTNQHFHISNSDLCCDDCFFSVAYHSRCWLLLWLELVLFFLKKFIFICVVFICFLKTFFASWNSFSQPWLFQASEEASLLVSSPRMLLPASAALLPTAPLSVHHQIQLMQQQLQQQQQQTQVAVAQVTFTRCFIHTFMILTYTHTHTLAAGYTKCRNRYTLTFTAFNLPTAGLSCVCVSS